MQLNDERLTLRRVASLRVKVNRVDDGSEPAVGVDARYETLAYAFGLGKVFMDVTQEGEAVGGGGYEGGTSSVQEGLCVVDVVVVQLRVCVLRKEGGVSIITRAKNVQENVRCAGTCHRGCWKPSARDPSSGSCTGQPNQSASLSQGHAACPSLPSLIGGNVSDACAWSGFGMWQEARTLTGRP